MDKPKHRVRLTVHAPQGGRAVGRTLSAQGKVRVVVSRTPEQLLEVAAKHPGDTVLNVPRDADFELEVDPAPAKADHGLLPEESNLLQALRYVGPVKRRLGSATSIALAQLTRKGLAEFVTTGLAGVRGIPDAAGYFVITAEGCRVLQRGVSP